MRTASEIEVLITSYLKRRGSNTSELSKVSGISRSTLYGYFNNPSSWRLGSLISIYNYLNIPQNERLFILK